RNEDAEIDTSGAGIAGTLRSEAAAVERVINTLVASKAIRQRRSALTVADAGSLELRACECYDSLRTTQSG
ncbi:MAG TPA: hypothetical protein VFT12_12620, partial [Thermoanaerobaculia bacterium]|nr:hypothetical protein [Thermoanaerobaculia bacterium]